jgi:hypothetical protein
MQYQLGSYHIQIRTPAAVAGWTDDESNFDEAPTNHEPACARFLADPVSVRPFRRKLVTTHSELRIKCKAISRSIYTAPTRSSARTGHISKLCADFTENSKAQHAAHLSNCPTSPSLSTWHMTKSANLEAGAVPPSSVLPTAALSDRRNSQPQMPGHPAGY